MKSNGYNQIRGDTELLEQHSKSAASFSIQFYPEYWMLNSGSKFSYNHQVSSLLDDIRALRIPPDFIELFDVAKVPYYEGCLIVELLDYRPQRAKEPVLEAPAIQRVVLRPSPETLWADLCLMNQRNGNQWTDVDALEVEARILVATAPPLCLDPDPHLTRIVNSIVRVSTPNAPNSLKRKGALIEPEEDELDKAKRAKLMQFMNPKAQRSAFQANYRIQAVKDRAFQKGIPFGARPPSVSLPVAGDPDIKSRPPSTETATPLAANQVQSEPANPPPPEPQPVANQAPIQPMPPPPPPIQQPIRISPIVPPTGIQMPIPTTYNQSPVDAKTRQSPVKPTPQLPTPSPVPPAQVPRPPSQPRPPSRLLQSVQETAPPPPSQPQPLQTSQLPTNSQAQNHAFQPLLPSHDFSKKPPQGKTKPAGQAQAPAQGGKTNAMPMQQAAHAATMAQQVAPHQAPALAAYFLQHQGMASQGLAQAQALSNGRAPPLVPNIANTVRSPMPGNQNIPGRASPMIGNPAATRANALAANQTQVNTSRSPMPQNTQPPQTPQLPQQIAPAAAASGHAAAYPNQVPHYNINGAHVRPTPGHPHHMVHHLGANRPQPSPSPNPQQAAQHQVQSSQQQQQTQHPNAPQAPQQLSSQEQPTAPQIAAFHPMMYNYAQVGMASYAPWSHANMGRGTGQIPMNINGQPMMPNMHPVAPAGHIQRLQGMGRAMQNSSLQGR